MIHSCSSTQDLLSLFYTDLRSHIESWQHVAFCLHCRVFICSCCSSTERWKAPIEALPTPGVDAKSWFCEFLSQGDDFAAAHTHGTARVQ